jgi:hypothetical protein
LTPFSSSSSSGVSVAVSCLLTHTAATGQSRWLGGSVAGLCAVPAMKVFFFYWAGIPMHGARHSSVATTATDSQARPAGSHTAEEAEDTHGLTLDTGPLSRASGPLASRIGAADSGARSGRHGSSAGQSPSTPLTPVWPGETKRSRSSTAPPVVERPGDDRSAAQRSSSTDSVDGSGQSDALARMRSSTEPVWE